MKQWQQLWAGAALVLSLGTACHAQILVGQTAGFTGQVAAGVKETTDGALLYIDAINAKGGVNGQKIELISLDDKFDPKLAADNAQVDRRQQRLCDVPEPGHPTHRGHHPAAG